MAKIQITGGGFQDSKGNVLASGYLEMVLSQDCQVTSTGQVCSGITVVVPLDSSGNVSGTILVWPNDQLTPSNNFYTVTAFSTTGQRVWGPNVQQITGAGPFNLTTWVPNQIVSWNPSISSITLQTNEVKNGSQTLLDLHAGTNVTLTDNGAGQVTIASTGGGGGSTLSINTQVGSSYTLQIGDAGVCVEMNNASANTLTVPPNSSVAFPIGTVVTIRQEGAGQTTIAAGGGVTIRTPETLLIRSQYGWVSLHKRATDEWCLEGNLQVAP
jgi:hypothetical protein